MLRTGGELLPDHLHTYTFTIRNPLQTSVAGSHSTRDIIAAAPVGSIIQGMPYHKTSQYQESAAYTVPANLGLRVVRQSNAMPGELNNISFLFRPSSTVLPHSRLVIDGLLDSNLLFARTTHEKCAGSMRDGVTNVAAALPFVDAAIPQAGTGPAEAGVSAGAAAGNRVHTAWSQELHADGQLRLLPCIADVDSCEQPQAFTHVQIVANTCVRVLMMRIVAYSISKTASRVTHACTHALLSGSASPGCLPRLGRWMNA